MRDWRAFPPEEDITVMLALEGMSLVSRNQWERADAQFADGNRHEVRRGTWLLGKRMIGGRLQEVARTNGTFPGTVGHENLLIYTAGAVAGLRMAKDPKGQADRVLSAALEGVHRAAGYPDPQSMLREASAYSGVVANDDDIGAACIVLRRTDPPLEDLLHLVPVFSMMNFLNHEWRFMMQRVTIK